MLKAQRKTATSGSKTHTTPKKVLKKQKSITTTTKRHLLTTKSSSKLNNNCLNYSNVVSQGLNETTTPLTTQSHHIHSSAQQHSLSPTTSTTPHPLVSLKKSLSVGKKQSPFRAATRTYSRGSIKKVKIPENYQPIDHDKIDLEKQREKQALLLSKLTPTGEYTLYQSNWSGLPLVSLITVSLISVSNIPMFSKWAEQGLWDLPPAALYAMGLGTVLGLGYAHVSLSRRWLKKITCKITDVNKIPSELTVTTGGWYGLGQKQQVNVNAFRGLALTHKENAKGLGPIVTVDCRIPQNYLIAWTKKAHWANPAGLLSKVLGVDDVSDITTSKGHTYDGKLYSDEDYNAVMEKMKQSKVDLLLPSQVKEELDRAANQSLTFEKSRKMGIYTRDQESYALEMAQNIYMQMAAANQELFKYETLGHVQKIGLLKEQVAELNKKAKEKVKIAQNSMTQKALHVFNPEIDFDGYTTEDALVLFKEVVDTQVKGRHPRTNLVNFVCGTDHENSEKIQQLATMYLKTKGLKFYIGPKGSTTEGVLTVVFQQIDKRELKKSDFENDQGEKVFTNINEIKIDPEAPSSSEASNQPQNSAADDKKKAKKDAVVEGNVPQHVQKTLAAAASKAQRPDDEWKM